MKNELDRRVQYTINILQKSLIELMQKKSINRITVCELCNYSDIHRSTFYMHYKDIYDLLDEIEENTFKDIERFFCKDNLSDTDNTDMVLFMYYVRDNADVMRVILSQDKSGSMLHFSNLLHAYYSRKWYHGAVSDPLEITYLYEFLYSGILGVIQKWLDTKCKDSPESVADIVWKIVKGAIFCNKNHA